MKNKQQVVILDGVEYRVEDLTVNVPLSVLLELMEEQQQETQKEVISVLKPFVSGDIGRERLQNIELGIEVVEEPYAPQTVMIVDSHNNRNMNLDFSNLRQTVLRRK